MFELDKPPSSENDAHFRTKNGDLFLHEDKVFSVPGSLVPGTSYMTFSGGLHLTSTGMDAKRCYIDHERFVFVLDDGSIVPYSSCYIAQEFRKTSPYDYLVDIFPLRVLPSFAFYDAPTNYLALRGVLTLCPIPSEAITECYKKFREDPYSRVEIGCTDTLVSVPLYLRPLFAKLTCSFVHRFGPQDYHDINPVEYNRIVGWLLDLVMRFKLPSLDEMIQLEMNVDEWLHIATYFNIPVFIHLFTELHTVALQ